MKQINSVSSDYVNNSVFRVSVGETELGFSSVKGLGASIEYDTYTEGGGRMHILPRPKTSAGTITFEKGFSLVDKQTAVMFAPGNLINDISIELVHYGAVAESYCIDEGIVTAWELGELNGSTTGVALKTFTVAHTGIRVMPA